MNLISSLKDYCKETTIPDKSLGTFARFFSICQGNLSVILSYIGYNDDREPVSITVIILNPNLTSHIFAQQMTFDFTIEGPQVH